MERRWVGTVVICLALAATTAAEARTLSTVDRDSVRQKIYGLDSALALFLAPGSEDELLRRAPSTARMESLVVSFRGKLADLKVRLNAAPATAHGLASIDLDYFTRTIATGMYPLTKVRLNLGHDPILRDHDDVASHVAEALTSLETSTRLLEEEILAGNAIYATDTSKPAPRLTRSEPMSDASFAALLRSVEEAGLDDSRLSVLGAATSNLFRSAQVARLIAALSFDETRVKALQLVASRIVDPGESFKILDSFSFSESKERARRILAR
jgi:hypothetical protein